MDEKGFAIYFSRSPIPHWRSRDPQSEPAYYKHLGIYGYRREFLLQLAGWRPTALERAEKLEQLRVLGHGFKMKVSETRFDSIGVDTPEDLARVRGIFDEGRETKDEGRVKKAVHRPSERSERSSIIPRRTHGLKGKS